MDTKSITANGSSALKIARGRLDPHRRLLDGIAADHGLGALEESSCFDLLKQSKPKLLGGFFTGAATAYERFEIALDTVLFQARMTFPQMLVELRTPMLVAFAVEEQIDLGQEILTRYVVMVTAAHDPTPV
jgi:hypothetical protein